MNRVSFNEVNRIDYLYWLNNFLQANPIATGAKASIYSDCQGNHIAYSIPGKMDQSNYGEILNILFSKTFRITIEENEVLVVAVLNDEKCLGFIKSDKQTGNLIEQRWYQ